MESASLKIELGSVDSTSGKLSFTFAVTNRGIGSIELYAFDPSDLRKSGIFLRLDLEQFRILQSILSEAEQNIAKLTSPVGKHTSLVPANHCLESNERHGWGGCREFEHGRLAQKKRLRRGFLIWMTCVAFIISVPLVWKRINADLHPVPSESNERERPEPKSVQESQAAALKRYSQLGISDSPINREFIRLHKDAQANHPDLLSRPDWPEVLAERAAMTCGK